MGSIFSALKILVQLVTALPALFEAWRKRRERADKEKQEEIVKEGREAVDHTTQTGDQRREEAALSGGRGGAPAQDRRGVRTRPVTNDGD